jgi:hypothetical protein
MAHVLSIFVLALGLADSPSCQLGLNLALDSPVIALAPSCVSEGESLTFSFRVENRRSADQAASLDELEFVFAGRVDSIDAPEGWSSQREPTLFGGTKVTWRPSDGKSGIPPGRQMEGFRVHLTGPDADVSCSWRALWDGGLGGGTFSSCVH